MEMERIRDISKVKAGDFISYKGTLAVVISLEIKEEHIIITLDDGKLVEKQKDQRMEFYRTIEKLHFD